LASSLWISYSLVDPPHDLRVRVGQKDGNAALDEILEDGREPVLIVEGELPPNASTTMPLSSAFDEPSNIKLTLFGSHPGVFGCRTSMLM
jgi:hypothetical protein